MRILAVLIGLASTAYADDGLRCGQRLVSVGEEQGAVLEKCGSPTTAVRRVEHAHTRYGERRITIETWTYDGGSGSFVRTLRFEDGVLRAVETGDYGR